MADDKGLVAEEVALSDADDVFSDGFTFGEVTSFLAVGGFIWAEDLLFCAVLFWLRVRDFPRGSLDSLTDLEAALRLGGEGVAFPGLGTTGDNALFLAGVFLRDDSGSAGGFLAGDAIFLLCGL